MAPAVGQTMQIGDNYQRRSFAAWKTPNIQPVSHRVLPCRPPHRNNMSFDSVSQRSRLTAGRCGVRRPPTSPTATAVGGVVVVHGQPWTSTSAAVAFGDVGGSICI